jgi:hypothetical protein
LSSRFPAACSSLVMGREARRVGGGMVGVRERGGVTRAAKRRCRAAAVGVVGGQAKSDGTELASRWRRWRSGTSRRG